LVTRDVASFPFLAAERGVNASEGLSFFENQEFNAAMARIDDAGFVMIVMTVAVFLFLLSSSTAFRRARFARTSMPPYRE
jgi:hypothetical protein